MTNKEEEKQVDQNLEIKPKEPSKKQNISTPPQSSLISKLALLLALAAICLIAWMPLSHDKMQKKWMNEFNSLVSKLDHLNQEQVANQEQMLQQKNSVKQTQEAIQAKLDHLNQELQTANNQKLFQNQDWQLLKARYYLELAQINAYWSADFNTAIALLAQSDKLLEPLYTPKIFEIRQAIAKEIALLKSIPALDKIGLLSQLDALQAQVDKLHILSKLGNPEAVTAEASPSDTKDATNNWRSKLNKNLTLLKSLVVIRRNDEQIKPLISPLFETILKECLRLNLQEAQWAILNSNPKVYQLALKQAIININRTFNKTSQETLTLLKQLAQLQQVHFTQERPKIDLALPLLDTLIQQGGLHPNPINQDKKGEN